MENSINKIKADDILDRPQYFDFIQEVEKRSIDFLKGKRVCITGSSGSIGSELFCFLKLNEIEVYGIDIVESHSTSHIVDIINKNDLNVFFIEIKPDIIFHLAANKYATECEINPQGAIDVNILGTKNIIDYAEKYNIEKLIFSSTCKAINPETVYGASKLINEKSVSLAGYSVVRLFNVVETNGNVFRLWEKSNTHKAMPCYRYFISLKEAVAMLLFCAYSESGIYTIDPGGALYMPDLCFNLYGRDNCVIVPKRTGDRVKELLCSTNELTQNYYGPILKIIYK